MSKISLQLKKAFDSTSDKHLEDLYVRRHELDNEQPMACHSFSFPVSSNATLGQQLRESLSGSFDLNVDNAILDSGSFLWVLYCASDTATQCHGICPNADLAGVGVRSAFWISSILQAILVAVSPEDSTQGSWTAAILTASVTIPALIQKRQRQLSIYHATLVLNFATFSSIVSLAVAPMCTVWRQRSQDDEDDHHGLRASYADDTTLEINVYGEEGRTLAAEPEPLTNLPKRKVHRQRLVLSLALLMQVALQWTWTVFLFTDPEYYQKACVPNTMVVLFGKTFSVGDLNHDSYFIWPLWLPFNLAIALVWGILLVYSSSPSVHPVLSRQPSLDLSLTTWWSKLPVDKARITVVSTYVLAFFISLLFLVSSEVQVAKNCVDDENSNWSFGQIAAILVALAPAWVIATAIERRQRSNQTRAIPDNDAEANSGYFCGSTSLLTPSEGAEMPLREVMEERRNESVSETVEMEPIYPSTLAVPQRYDVLRHSTPYPDLSPT